ncbi:hypothetical protein SRHO_G00023110 [Serrasalmus rhombeus]
MSSWIYMTSLLFSLVSGHLQGKILQLDSVVTAKEGDDVTLSCLHPTDQINKVLCFGAGTVLVLKGQDYKKYTVLQPTVPQKLHPEDSVTLQCSVLTESCSGEHNRPGGESMHVTIMICLAVLLFISLTINVSLCLTCRKKEIPSQQVMTSDDTMSTVQHNLNYEMNYTALKFNTKSTKVKRERQQEETVYSRVTGQNQI